MSSATTTNETAEFATKKRSWLLLTGAATIALVVGFFALRDDSSGGEIETAANAGQATPAEPVTTTSIEMQETAVFQADAPLIVNGYSPLERGTARFETLGTPFSVTLDEDWWVQQNSSGLVALTHPDSIGPDDRDIVFQRLSDLSDPTQPDYGLAKLYEVWPADVGEGWPAADFAGWLDNLTDEIVVSNRQETTLAGMAATRVDLKLGETDCTERRGFCMLFGTSHLMSIKMLSPGSTYRVWFIDQGDEDPLAVIVGINRDSDADWFTTAEKLLTTLAFGDIRPNPVIAVAPGEVELPYLGGVRTELSEETIVFENGDRIGRVAPEIWPGDTEFLTNPLDFYGRGFEVPDDLVTAFLNAGIQVTELEPTVIDGIETRVFDVAGAGSFPQPVLRLADSNEKGWRPGPRGRMWLVDHPDRGLLMIHVWVFDSVDTTFPELLTRTEPIIESLEFIDIG